MSFPWFESQFNAIVERASAKKLHHGLLFVGSRGTGKSDILVEMARYLLCSNKSACGQCQSCLLYKAGNHPDLIVTQYDKTIGVDTIREGINRLSQTSHLGSDKVMLVNNAHKMTAAASNALLKTLEEPTKNTFILMSATSTNELLPTILSRCEKHMVQVKHKESVQLWLKERNVSAATELIDLYWTKPKLIESIVQDEGLQECVDWLKTMHKPGTALAVPGKLHEEHQLLLDWLNFQMAELKRAEISDAIKLRIFDMYSAVTDAQKKLQAQGVNKALILEKLLQTWRHFSTFI
ncbi:DNA polymerase III subunit delta' [Planctobacterium marinum]|uniref:DNA-directed DNA polymerase n=1 Tax=Planctobacterium marinum TaxID=1631968 RepID=A0AA48HKX2_9ALTE|nr:DNA polymerase III subunit delta' [Planctobacterium marinum]